MTDTTAPLALPGLNRPAPDFSANTTDGPRSLSDYKGRWLVLFSHPADFTPVCTTEFIGFAKHHGQFKALGCELHIAWIRNIEEKFGVVIPFPIIEDLSMKVAHAYGMVQPGASDTSAVRATFVIDPEGVLRAMLYYPMSNGRSVPEILRLVTALQASESQKIATPEGWTPGQDAIVPPPKTAEAARQRGSEGYATTDWYFSTRKVA
jgi:peroxiredoxin (alkyl hydroperoxide reductase subunit C)